MKLEVQFVSNMMPPILIRDSLKMTLFSLIGLTKRLQNASLLSGNVPLMPENAYETPIQWGSLVHIQRIPGQNGYHYIWDAVYLIHFKILYSLIFEKNKWSLMTKIKVRKSLRRVFKLILARCRPRSMIKQLRERQPITAGLQSINLKPRLRKRHYFKKGSSPACSTGSIFIFWIPPFDNWILRMDHITWIEYSSDKSIDGKIHI